MLLRIAGTVPNEIHAGTLRWVVQVCPDSHCGTSTTFDLVPLQAAKGRNPIYLNRWWVP
jgi:hypothetical protein